MPMGWVKAEGSCCSSALPISTATPLGLYPPLCQFFINKRKALAWVGDSSSLQIVHRGWLCLLVCSPQDTMGQHWLSKGWCTLPYTVCLLRHVGTM